MKYLKLLFYCLGIAYSAESYALHYDYSDETDIRFSYELTTAYDDNIRRAKYDEDIRDDSTLGFNMGLGSIYRLGHYSILDFFANVEAEKFKIFEELDNTVFNAGVKYQFAFASHLSSPVYSLKLSVGGIDSNSEMRVSNMASIGLGVEKWLSTSIRFISTLSFKIRDSQSEVFDTEESQFMMNFDVDLSRRSLVYFSYHFADGDIVSSSSPTLEIINIAKVIEPDDAFGGLATNQFAYQIDAQSHIYTLGFNSAINQFLSLDLSFRFIDSEAIENDEIYYERQIFRASLLGRF